MNDRIPDEVRYARQIRFSPIGTEGQSRITASTVAVVGMGALGCVIAQHLARGGVGRLRLIDRDIVEASNLQRQILYDEDDVRQVMPKAEAAARRLKAANSSIQVDAEIADLSPANAEELLRGVDLILDGTDNFSTRYLINDYSIKHRIPWIYGGAVGSGGMMMTIRPGSTPCYRCLFPSAPQPGTTDTCETAGVLSPAIDMAASLQTAEAFKLLAGRSDMLHGNLLQFDIWNTRLTQLKIAGSKRAECPCCGLCQYEFLEPGEAYPAVEALCGRSSVQLTPAAPMRLNLDELAARLQAAGTVERNPYLLKLLLQDEYALILFPDGRALIQGTNDPVLAKRIYTRIMAP
ncbi:ThiF family adenylyltransferase [Paenibacillus tarimensis]|uniref:ThiF family adenylyltransferase n=1 Tax=Paenibacillus tarimensis TaxID=416012 RepID=UPI001F1F5BED|nr:ThiF family adenylyltransferase [Paenibacillus tarimensis]MCF2943866.1 ThiF family adenylyltransferase [Paenibacillus tarimensis]